MKCFFLDVKFRGGLGNQLFQYATARNLCEVLQIPYLIFDTSGYINESLNRKFSIAQYRIKGRQTGSAFGNKISRVNTKFNSLLKLVKCYELVQEKDFSIQQIQIPRKPLVSLSGFWQSEHYFKNIRAQLLDELVPRHIPPLPAWLQQNTVAIHVRRTDYLDEPRYGFLGTNYYIKSIAVIRQMVNDPFFVFFSDDLEWCKKNFTGINALFFNDADWEQDYLQLYLMAQCQHQVIANSSFSWWAAWLNNHSGKVVIRPEHPFIEPSLLYQSHYPAAWLAVNNRHE